MVWSLLSGALLMPAVVPAPLLVHVRQQIQIVRLHALVHLVDGGVDRAELDDFRPGGSDEAPIGCAPVVSRAGCWPFTAATAATVASSRAPVSVRKGWPERVHFSSEVQAVTGQQRLDPLADSRIGELGAEAEVELDLQLPG